MPWLLYSSTTKMCRIKIKITLLLVILSLLSLYLITNLSTHLRYLNYRLYINPVIFTYWTTKFELFKDLNNLLLVLIGCNFTYCKLLTIFPEQFLNFIYIVYAIKDILQILFIYFVIAPQDLQNILHVPSRIFCFLNMKSCIWII